jgi:hypothetical protein
MVQSSAVWWGIVMMDMSSRKQQSRKVPHA